MMAQVQAQNDHLLNQVEGIINTKQPMAGGTPSGKRTSSRPSDGPVIGGSPEPVSSQVGSTATPNVPGLGAALDATSNGGAPRLEQRVRVGVGETGAAAGRADHAYVEGAIQHRSQGTGQSSVGPRFRPVCADLCGPPGRCLGMWSAQVQPMDVVPSVRCASTDTFQAFTSQFAAVPWLDTQC